MWDFFGIGWDVWQFLKSDAGTAIIVALFALSEALGAIPQVKANSVYQAIYNALKKLAPSKAVPSILLAAALAVGCSGVSRVVSDEGGGRVRVQETYRDLSALGPTTATVIVRWCDGQVNGSIHNCNDQGTPQLVHTSGYLSGIFNSAVLAGGMVGLGYGLASDHETPPSQTQIQSSSSTSSSTRINGGGGKH